MARPRVVIVDDNEDARFLVRLRLEETGCDVVGEGSDGIEAIDLVQSLQPDAVVMDMRMPGLGGIEATRTIKTRTPDTSVIIVSASDDPADLEEVLDAGASTSLSKLDFEEIGKALREIDLRD